MRPFRVLLFFNSFVGDNIENIFCLSFITNGVHAPRAHAVGGKKKAGMGIPAFCFSGNVFYLYVRV